MFVVLRLLVLLIGCGTGSASGHGGGTRVPFSREEPPSPRKSVTFSFTPTAEEDETPRTTVTGEPLVAGLPPMVLRQPEWRFHKFNLNNWLVRSLTNVIDEVHHPEMERILPSRLPHQQFGLHLITFFDWEACEGGCRQIVEKILNFVNAANSINTTKFGTETTTQLIFFPIHETKEKHDSFFRSSVFGEIHLSGRSHISVLPYESGKELFESMAGARRDDNELVNKLFVLDWTGESVVPDDPLAAASPAPQADLRGICAAARDPMYHIEMCKADGYASCVYMKIEIFRDRCNFLYTEIRDALFQLRQRDKRVARPSATSPESSPSMMPASASASERTPPPLDLGSSRAFRPSANPETFPISEVFLKQVRQIVKHVMCERSPKRTLVDPLLKTFSGAFSRYSRILHLINRVSSSILGLESSLSADRYKPYCRFVQHLLDDLSFLAHSGNALQSDTVLRKKNVGVMFQIGISYKADPTGVYIRDTFPRNLSELESFIRDRFFPEKPSQFFRVFVANDGAGGEELSQGQLYYERFDDIAESLSRRCDVSRNICPIRFIVLEAQPYPSGYRPLSDTARALADINELEKKLMSGSILRGSIPAILVMKSIEIEEYQRMVLEQIPISFLHDTTISKMKETRVSASAQSTPRVSVSSTVSYEEEFLKVLINWFSEEYFQWVPNPIPCQNQCGDNMQFRNQALMDDPDAERDKIEYQKRVLCEKHVCGKCGDELWFVRQLTDVMQLFRNRQGRCGEFAKVFALVARALGYPVRLVMGQFIDPSSDGFGIFVFKKSSGAGSDSDSSDIDQRPLDHMWNEVYIEARGEWVHVDVSIGAMSNMGITDPSLRYDHPLIYDEEDYPIKLVSVISAEHDRVAVLTPKYLTGYIGLERAESRGNMSRQKQRARKITSVMRGESDMEESLLREDTLSPDEREIREDRSILERFPLDPLVGKKPLRDSSFKMGSLRIDGDTVPAWQSAHEDQLFSSYVTLMSLKEVPEWWVSKVTVCQIPIMDSPDGAGPIMAVNEMSFEYSVMEINTVTGVETSKVIRESKIEPYRIEKFKRGHVMASVIETKVCKTREIARDDYITTVKVTRREVGGRKSVISDAEIRLRSDYGATEEPVSTESSSSTLVPPLMKAGGHRRAASADFPSTSSLLSSDSSLADISGGLRSAGSTSRLNLVGAVPTEPPAPFVGVSKIVGVYGSRQIYTPQTFEFVGFYAIDINRKE